MTEQAQGDQASGQSSSQGGSQAGSGAGSQQGNGSQTSQTNSQSGTQSQTQQSNQGQQGSQQGQQGTQQQTVSRPEYVPETFWDASKNAVKGKEFGEHYNAMAARIAAEDSRKLTLPQTADAYKVELPADFKPPEGVKFAFQADDPLLSQARTVAHELGIPQEGFSKLLGLYAGAQVATQQQITVARNAEIAKLGTTGPARIDALTTFFKAYVGESEGNQLMARMFTAGDVQIAEKMVAKITAQGGAGFRQTGREPPQPQGRVTDEEFKRMSAAERLDYTRKFDQRQFQNNGRAA